MKKNVLTASKHAIKLFVALILTISTELVCGEEQPVIIDADTSNEVDDPYAIARALIEPSWKVLALNATQWQASHWAEPQSMEASHRLNQVLLGEMGLSVKTRRGGAARMYDWGDKAQHSAAAYEIIQQAKQMPAKQKLTVLALGALTNVASAVTIDPAIQSRIRVYWLGTSYDFVSGIMKETDFNCVMDVQAVEIMLTSQVEMHLMPVNVAKQMEFTYAETEQQLRGRHRVGTFLCDRWYKHLGPSRRNRVIWDLALVEAMVHPEWAEEVEIKTSQENGGRNISYYRSIDAAKMKAEFFETINAYYAD